MIANAKQKQLIHLNTPNRDIKEEFVQWATGDVNKTSTNDLSFEQANAILVKLGKKPFRPTKEDSPYFWGMFDNKNQQHRLVLSRLHQLQWTIKDPRRGRVPDIQRFGEWLQSKNYKPLKKMDEKEVNKVLAALKGMIKSIYK